MNDLDLAATERTPRIVLRHALGTISIQGCSIPENADRFFGPVLDQVELYMQRPAPATVARIELSYFNTSTSKYLLDLFKLLEDLHASGRSLVSMEWQHAANDLDMQEVGEDFKALLEYPVRLVKK
ncbi:MAG: DUF1987 domain-containing protein [Flavobacteriales bacterium]|nr:DUF1987 domain-containing protein [Flavobacteriales bacterium]